MFIFNFLFHNSHDKFDRQIIVSNQINQIESWRKHRCFAWVWKRVCHHQGSNSWPRTWCSVLMFRAECDTTQLSRDIAYSWQYCNEPSCASYLGCFIRKKKYIFQRNCLFYFLRITGHGRSKIYKVFFHVSQLQGTMAAVQ